MHHETQTDSDRLAGPGPAPSATDWRPCPGRLRGDDAAEKGGVDIGISPAATDRRRALLVESIKKAVSGFYMFAEAERIFPPFPAQFVFEDRSLRVRFPRLIAVGFFESGDQFCGLLALIAGSLGLESCSRPADMKQLLMAAVDGRELDPAGNPLPRLGLRVVSANMAELSFESEEL